MSRLWQVGIDVGGTFTDVVAINIATAQIRCAKVATRTDDRVAGLVTALNAVGLEWCETADLIHGTTMVTNAIVEGRLAEVALITTTGFADSLDIGRQNRRYLYRLDLPPKLTPQVPSERRFEVEERLDHQGTVLQAMTDASVDNVIRQLQASGAQAVAVSLLHAYANPQHEEQLRRHLAAEFPYLALSNRVNPEAREFERTATTVLSASVMPMTAEYLDKLEAAKPEHSRLHLFHSAGGMASTEALRELPLGLALSGPAAGVAAAGQVATRLGIEHAISFDMGGTTTDVCLITAGQAQVSTQRSVAGRPLRQAMVAVESIGAGGGSIARLDQGTLRVGPESAGAVPGPACYGRGGIEPTVSDANLLLGYLQAEKRLGGELQLNLKAARDAIAPLAVSMNMSIEQAALGIVRVANSAMVRALGRITVEKGIDGRQCTLIAFGGAGPMHAVEVARAFGISRLLIPAHSSAFSALGCVSAQLSYSQQQSVHMPVSQWDPERLQTLRETLRQRLLEPLLATGKPLAEICIEEVAAVRYSGQSYAIELTHPDLGSRKNLGSAFLEEHHKRYGFATDEPWELVALRIRAWVPQAAPGTIPAAAGRIETSAVEMSMCNFQRAVDVPTPRLDRAGLVCEQTLHGPVIIEDAWSTVVVPPDGQVKADVDGHLHVVLDSVS